MATRIKETRNLERSSGDTEEQRETQTLTLTTRAMTFRAYNTEKEDLEDYLEAYECHCALFKVRGIDKVHLILSSVGADSFKKIRAVLFPLKPRDADYDDIIEALKEIEGPKMDPSVAKQTLRSRYQNLDEPFADFLTALRELAVHCKFEGKKALEAELKDQIIIGVRNPNTKYAFRREGTNKTLKELIALAEGDEQAEKDIAKQLNRSNVGKTSQIDKVQFNKKGNNNNRIGHSQNNFRTNQDVFCYRCGLNNHFANKCRYLQQTCSKCKKIGHIAKMCGRNPKPKDSNSFNNKPWKNRGPRQQGQANRIEYADIRTSKIKNVNAKDKIIVRMEIGQEIVPFELDTGASYSVMSIKQFKNLKLTQRIRKTEIQLLNYDKTPISMVGMVTLPIKYQAQRANVNLYLVKGNLDALLGRDWLKYFKIDLASIYKINTKGNTLEFCDTDISNRTGKKLVEEFNDVFQNSVGCIPDVEAKIHLKENSKPIFLKARPVPYAITDKVTQEILRLESIGIITKKETKSEWATPVVPIIKPSGEVRLCGDYKATVNKFIIPHDYPFPTVDDILAKLGNGKFFSKFDVREAFLHMRVEKDTADLLTINTHMGLYRVNRLWYGVASAPALWQQIMEQMFQHIPGLQCFYDDVKISSPDKKTHLIRIRQFLEACRKNNIKLKLEKCSLWEDKIQYLGYVIDAQGIHKTPEKVSLMLNARVPTNVAELRSFLGLVNYYAKFIPESAKLMHPLFKLLKRDCGFKWTSEQQIAFEKLKAEIASDKVLAHFDPNLPIVVATDASQHAIGCVLSHRLGDGEERPIAFAGRALSDAEARYSVTDKEALAIIWGIKKFFNYIFGRRFTLITDHKPLQAIFDAHRQSPSISANRLLRYAIFLQGFEYHIEFRKTTEHANADFCSRFPDASERNCKSAIDDTHMFEVRQLSVLPINMSDLAKETSLDSETVSIMRELQNKNYKIGLNKDGGWSLNNGCVFRGNRVLIPRKYHKVILQELHEGHIGCTKMKQLARSYVFWDGIDKAIEEYAYNCPSCRAHAKAPKAAKTHHWENPSGPWQRIHVDFAGPFKNQQFLLIVDAYTRWLEVFPLINITASSTIEKLRECFARFGLPHVLVSDNGKSFVGTEIKNFLKENGIKHVLTPPYHPSSNGHIERCVQTFKNSIRAAITSKETMNVALNNFLLAYRRAPHSSTNKSPAEAMFGRRIDSRLDLITRVPHEGGRETESEERLRKFNIGDAIYMRMYSPHHNKWERGRIVSKKGLRIYTIECNGSTYTRHIDQIVKDKSEFDEASMEPFYKFRPRFVSGQNTQHETAAEEHAPGTSENPNRDNGSGTHSNESDGVKSDTQKRPDKSLSPAKENDPGTTTTSRGQRTKNAEPCRRSSRQRRSPDRLIYVKKGTLN